MIYTATSVLPVPGGPTIKLKPWFTEFTIASTYFWVKRTKLNPTPLYLNLNSEYFYKSKSPVANIIKSSPN